MGQAEPGAACLQCASGARSGLVCQPQNRRVMLETLQLQLAALDQPALYEPANFQRRAAAIDAIAAQIIDPLDDALAYPAQPRALRALRRAAEHLQQRLHAADAALFHELRARIRGGLRGAALLQQIEQLDGMPAAKPGRAVVGYDRLDRLVSGVLDADELPAPRLEPEPEMVLNQRTPARIVFELVQRAHFGPQDCFCDLGAGTGHVAALVHLLSGVRACGVEFEPAFCEYARARAAALGLSQVEFINADARHADYAAGTFFYMYTPFEGAMLRAVLERLRERSRRGPIRLATYGPCTAIVAQEQWLPPPSPAEPGGHRLAIFSAGVR